MKKSLTQMLADCSTEEEVKFNFVRYFQQFFKRDFKFDSRKNIDSRLRQKLLPQIYSLGFLRDEVTYFE